MNKFIGPSIGTSTGPIFLLIFWYSKILFENFGINILRGIHWLTEKILFHNLNFLFSSEVFFCEIFFFLYQANALGSDLPSLVPVSGTWSALWLGILALSLLGKS